MAGRAIEVLDGRIQTTVQDYPGRRGMLRYGLFPAGPMDHFAFRAANLLVGNSPSTAALEVALGNFALRFDTDATVAVCGAEVATSLDGEPFGLWESRRVERGSELRMEFAQGPGFRMYVALAGGVDVPPFFGSRSTYTMGALGGHEGRPLRQGDRLILGEEQATARRRGASRNRPAPSTRVSGRSRRPGGPQATPTT